MSYWMLTMQCRRLLLVCSAALACLVPAGCAGNSSPPSDGPAVAEPPVVVPGDKLRITFSVETNLNGEFVLDEYGLVNLPILGSRELAGLSPASARSSLLAEYASQVRNQSVQLVYLMRIRVLGSVRSPGLYYADATMTLGDVLALAGGANNEGKPDEVELVRGDQTVTSNLDLSSAVGTDLRSGDQVVVPMRSWLSRNSGAVVAASISAIGFIVALSN